LSRASIPFWICSLNFAALRAKFSWVFLYPIDVFSSSTFFFCFSFSIAWFAFRFCSAATFCSTATFCKLSVFIFSANCLITFIYLCCVFNLFFSFVSFSKIVLSSFKIALSGLYSGGLSTLTSNFNFLILFILWTVGSLDDIYWYYLHYFYFFFL